MKIRPHRINFLVLAFHVFLGCALPGLLSAEEPEEDPPREIESLIISDKRPPTFYHLTLEDEYRPFRIGFQRAGGINRVQPSDSLTLYRRIENEEDPEAPTYQSALALELPSGDTPLLLVFYLDREGVTRHRFLDAGPEAFEPQEVQLVNLSDTLPVIVMLGGTRFDLKPKTELRAVAKIRQDQRFSFRYGSKQPSGDLYASPETRLKIPFENMRLRIFFAPVQRTIQTEDGPKTEMVLRDARVFEIVTPK